MAKKDSTKCGLLIKPDDVRIAEQLALLESRTAQKPPVESKRITKLIEDVNKLAMLIDSPRSTLRLRIVAQANEPIEQRLAEQHEINTTLTKVFNRLQKDVIEIGNETHRLNVICKELADAKATTSGES